MINTSKHSSSEGSAVTGVILTAGEGRRMGKLGNHLPKACLPLLTQPLLANNLRLLHEIGIRETVVVLGHHFDMVLEASRCHAPANMALRFIEQPKPVGIADALYRTRDLVGESIVLLLGDTHFVPHDLSLGLRMLTGNGDGTVVAAVLSVRPVSDPTLIQKECTVQLDEDGCLIAIEEKPEKPLNNIKPCGIYFFSRRIFEAISKTPASAIRNEVEITDSIQTLVDLNYKVRCAQTVEWDNNLTYPIDLLISNLYELQRLGCSSIVGNNTEVHADAVLRETIVCDGARITAPARLEHSLVLANGRLEEPGIYEGCIIGPDFILHCDLEEIANSIEEFSRPAVKIA